jgi:hypothetical protein
MSRARSLAVILLALAGCGGGQVDVTIALKGGNCGADIGDPRFKLLSVRAVFKKTGAVLDSCLNVDRYGSLAELQHALGATMSPLGPVAESGVWDLLIAGTDRLCCSNQEGSFVSLWGRVPSLTLPRPDNRIEVPINCLLAGEVETDIDLATTRENCYQAVKTLTCGP